MGQYGSTFALIGVTYAGVDCGMEGLRGSRFPHEIAFMSSLARLQLLMSAGTLVCSCQMSWAGGKKDMWNGVAGGIASGAVMGARIGRISSGVAAAFAMAIMSALVDANEGHLVGRSGIDDGATPKHIIYPYPKSAERGTA